MRVGLIVRCTFELCVEWGSTNTGWHIDVHYVFVFSAHTYKIWMGHSWLLWVGQLWQSELWFLGDMLQKHWSSGEYPSGHRMAMGFGPFDGLDSKFLMKHWSAHGLKWPECFPGPDILLELCQLLQLLLSSKNHSRFATTQPIYIITRNSFPRIYGQIYM